jgi:hypothetical protein
LKTTKSILLKLFLIVGLLMAGSTFAQEDPCNDPFNPNPDDPNCDPDIFVPIDDGVYFLLAAGVIVGYQLIKKRTHLNTKV